MTFTEKLREAAEKCANPLKQEIHHYSEEHQRSYRNDFMIFMEGGRQGLQLAINQLNSLEAAEDLVGVIKSPADAARWLEQWRERT